MIPKTAFAYLINDCVVVIPRVFTTRNAVVSGAPTPVAVSQSDEIGRTALKALDASNSTIPHPENGNTLMKPILQATRTRSWKELASRASQVQIQFDADRTSIVVTPLIAYGPKGGYGGPDLPPSTASIHDVEAIGRAVLDAFTRCKRATHPEPTQRSKRNVN